MDLEAQHRVATLRLVDDQAEQAVLGATDRLTLQEAHLRLAQMHEELGQDEAAASHYRDCALITQPAGRNA